MLDPPAGLQVDLRDIFAARKNWAGGIAGHLGAVQLPEEPRVCPREWSEWMLPLQARPEFVERSPLWPGQLVLVSDKMREFRSGRAQRGLLPAPAHTGGPTLAEEL